MTRLPRITAKEVFNALQRNGFEVIRTRGSHHFLHRPGSGIVTVSIHPGEIIKPKTLKSILNQAGLTVDELIDSL
jgi:predicted RNA binding protein YcfA (HicA-like mRNA interferase family)